MYAGCKARRRILPQAWQRHVEDEIQAGTPQTACSVHAPTTHSLFPVSTIDPPLMIIIKPPLGRIGLPDRLRQLLGDVGFQAQS